MPVSIVVGGQYGSEGKGKVTHWLARKRQARYAIRVGGPNSGHTVVDKGRRTVLRALPTPTLIDGVIGVVPAGAYLDVDVLLREVEKTGLTKDRLLIHPWAVVIDDSMKEYERQAGLVERIGVDLDEVKAQLAEISHLLNKSNQRIEESDDTETP